MSPREAVQLTAYLQAHFPQQPVSEFTPEALSELLEPYALTDCKAAVLALAMRVQGSEGQKWCSPTDIYAEVRRARARRLDDAVTSPPADLDPDNTAAYAAWLRSEQRRIADGGAVSPAGELVSRDVIAELGQAGRANEIPSTQIRTNADRLRAEARAGKAERVEKPDPEPLPEVPCVCGAGMWTAECRSRAHTTGPTPEPPPQDAPETSAADETSDETEEVA